MDARSSDELKARVVDPTLADEDVIARVIAGDIGLFEVLMRRYNQRVYRAARAILRDEAEVEDVMQETYLRAFAMLAQFEGRSQWSTWITRIAVNESLARVRKRGRFVNSEAFDVEDGVMDREQESGTRPAGPEGTAATRELSAFVEHAIDALPDIYRAVFVLREVEELSGAETATCLDISEDLVKVRLNRARNELRHLLDARLGSAAREMFEFHAARCDRVVATVLSRLRS